MMIMIILDWSDYPLAGKTKKTKMKGKALKA